MNELIEKAKSLGIEVNPEWSERYLRRTITMAENKNTDEKEDKENISPMFPVVLNKNYSPMGKFEIVGYLQKEVKKKLPDGKWEVVSREKFIEGEMMPPPNPGVGFPGKVWAGTHIKLPIDEARNLIVKKIADRADAIAA